MGLGFSSDGVSTQFKLNGVKTATRIFSVCLFSSVLWSAQLAPAAAQNFTFSQVIIDGNTRIGDSAVLSRAGITRGQTVSAGQLSEAFNRLQDSGLFESVEIVPSGNTLRIVVVEYPTINRVSFEGNKRLKDEALSALITSTERLVFNPTTAETDAANIAEAYSSSGRLAARVTPKVIKRRDNRVDLVFEIFEGDVVEIERLSFVGNREFSDRRLRRVLQTKQAGFLRALVQSDTFIEDRVEFDQQVLRDFYQSRGYVDFRINAVNSELAQERDGFFLTFNIQEGQQFTFGEITTTSQIDSVNSDDYQDVVKIEPGVVYSPALIEQEISRMERLATRDGVDFLRVEPRISRNDRDLTLSVEFVLSRGPRVFVERIDIEGNTTTLDRVIRTQFDSVEGDPFNPREIRQAAERIRALGYFGNAEVNAREGSSPDKVIVDVDVEEQPTGSLQFGGSFSASDGFGIAVGLSEDNFLGRGQRVRLNFSTAEETESYGIQFTEPNFLGRDVSFGLSLNVDENTSSFATYDEDVFTFSPSLTFPIGENSRLQVRYTAESSEQTARDPAEHGTVVGLDIAAGKQFSSSVGYRYVYDTRITGLNPDAGVLFEFAQDFAGLGGDSEYIRTTAKVVGQRKVLNDEVTLRATFEGGVLGFFGGTNRTADRFTLGPEIIRGFEPGGIGPRETSGTTDDALGGNLFAVARFEAEFPIGLPEEYGIKGALFYDVGNLWSLDDVNIGSATVSGEGGSFRQVIGFGILWDTPVGPLRFNFTDAIQKESFDREQSFDLTLSTNF